MNTECNLCGLRNASNGCLTPTGSSNPDYYILGYTTSVLDIANNNPFDGEFNPGNTYLINILESLGINDSNSRKFKCLRCVSEDRNITEDHIMNCKQYFLRDIEETKPKVVIGLGSTVAQLLLGDKFKYMSTSRGKLYDAEFGSHKCKVIITYNPSYVLQNSGQNVQSEEDDEDFASSNSTELADLFYKDISYANLYVGGKLVDIDTKDLRCATTYDEFKKYYDEKLIYSDTPAYDIESNARDQRCADFRMVGFSLAPDSSGGIYIVRNSLEYDMPEDDWNKIVDITKDYIMSRNVKVHNCMYEIPSTLNEWGIKITNFTDTLIKARMLLGGKTGAGLKDQCIMNLGYPDWDSDLGEYSSNFTNVWNKLYPTSAGKDRWDFVELKEKGFNGLLQSYEMYKNDDALDKRSLSSYESCLILKDICSKYYEGEEFYNILELVGKKIVTLIDIRFDGPFSYGFIPMKVISAYGAMDAVGTQDLDVFLTTRMDKESTSEVDLHRGYNLLKTHFIAGTHMEMNGLYWNEDVASSEYDWYANECYKSCLKLIDSPYLDDYLYENNWWVLRDEVVNNRLDYVMEVLGPFTLMKSGIKITETGEKISFKNILDKLGENYVKQHRQFIIDGARKYAHDTEQNKSYWDLKGIFNPGSPAHKELLNKILVNTNVQVASIIKKLNLIIDDPETKIESYPMPDRYLLEIIINCRKYNKEVEEFNETEGLDESEKRTKLSNKDIYEKFYNSIMNMQLVSKQMQDIVKEALSYRLVDTREPSLIELYENYTLMGIDIEDMSTWTPEFEFLYNYRVWKKCNKMITSYITGPKIGRGAVWIVNREKVEQGTEMPIRERLLDDKYNPETELTLMQPTFGVCTAETLRWRAGLHTIPAGSSIKNIYTSRYKGGCLAAPDFSQMEIRAIAGASKCTPMLEAFKNGADIHLWNASQIWRKPPEEITKAERRYAKMASFSILYGSTPHNFAMEFLGGDVALGEQIFDNFYSAFPEIRTWIDERHEEMRTTGKVATPMGYFLSISPANFNGDENKALRAAQNYPIQSSGSTMAGYVLYKVNELILNNNFKSRVILFIHDSIEIDIHPDELLSIGAQILPFMNKIPLEEFGIPTKADLTLGISMGQDLEVPKVETDDKFNEGILTVEGYEDDFDLLINNWKSVYKHVEFKDIEEPTPVYIPRGDLFIPKKAIHRAYGSSRNKIVREVKLQIK